MSNEQRAPSASPDLSRIAANSMMELVKSIFDAPTMEAGYAILNDWAWQCGHGVPVALRSASPSVEPADLMRSFRNLAGSNRWAEWSGENGIGDTYMWCRCCEGRGPETETIRHEDWCAIPAALQSEDRRNG